MSQIAEISNADFWRRRTPSFHIGDAAFWGAVRRYQCSNAEAAAMNGKVQREGYFRLRHDFGLDLGAMAAVIAGLVADGFPPVFAFVYDEFWALFQALDPVYGNILGRYGLLPDFWVWHVDAAQGEAGWKPHRDKGRQSLRPDGTPLSLSTWIPLTDATPAQQLHVCGAGRSRSNLWDGAREGVAVRPAIHPGTTGGARRCDDVDAGADALGQPRVARREEAPHQRLDGSAGDGGAAFQCPVPAVGSVGAVRDAAAADWQADAAIPPDVPD
jgi:hypothetical protein